MRSLNESLFRTHTLTDDLLVSVPASGHVEHFLLLPDSEELQEKFEDEDRVELWQVVMWNRRDSWLPVGCRRGARAAMRSMMASRGVLS